MAAVAKAYGGLGLRWATWWRTSLGDDAAHHGVGGRVVLLLDWGGLDSGASNDATHHGVGGRVALLVDGGGDGVGGRSDGGESHFER